MFDKAGVAYKRFVREFRFENAEEYSVKDEIKVDVFVAGVGKWYEFKCEETALIRDIIKEIYDVIRDKESIICEKQIDLELYLACIENKRILPLDFKLEESGVENGNRLILF